MRMIVFVVAMGFIAGSGVTHAQNSHASVGDYRRAVNELATTAVVRCSASSGERPHETRDNSVERSTDSTTTPRKTAHWLVIVSLLGLSIPALNCFIAIGLSAIADLVADEETDCR